MDLILWIIVISFFVLSFVGLVFPVLPSVLALWGGFLVYHFFLDPSQLTLVFWVSMALLTALLILADLFTGAMAVKRFGGSKIGERAATVAVILGTFVYPPFGILLLPFITVLIIEYWQQDTFSQALRAALGTLIGFLSGRVAEAMIQLIMISWFFLSVWL